MLGTFELTGIQAQERGYPKIEVVFDVDADGIFTVTANDITDDEIENWNQLIINDDKGKLTEDQIEAYLQEAKKFEYDDEIFQSRMRAKNDFENFLYKLRATITKDERVIHNITDEDHAMLKDPLANEWEWFKATEVNEGDGEIYRKKLDRLEIHVIQPVLNRINEKLREEAPEDLVKEDEEKK